MHPTENVRVSPVAMTAGKVWHGLKCFSQRPDYPLPLIEPVVCITVYEHMLKTDLLENLSLLMIPKTKKMPPVHKVIRPLPVIDYNSQ